MAELTVKTIYYLWKNLAFVTLFAILCEQKKTKKLLQKGTQIIALTCMQQICTSIFGKTVTSLIIIALYYLLLQMECKMPFKARAIKITFAFAARELVCMLCSLVSAAVCAVIFHETDWITVTIGCGILLIAFLCLCAFFFRKRALPLLGEKYSIGIFAFVLALTFGSFGVIKAPNYSDTNRDYFLFVLFVLAICSGLLVLWAQEERKVLEKETRIGQALEQAARERDDLLTANHRLGKTLPELEHKYDKLAEKVRRMETLPHKEEFAAELDALSAVRCRVVQQTERVDTDTGVPGLKGSVEYVAHIAEERGVLFGCRILAGLDKLSDYPGITEQSLRQLLRNLLDNAIHAAARAERSPKMVQCMMGVAGNCYQIDVYDSGDPFQSHILENLGRMGNTTDGNGVGLPDVLDISARCGASIFVTHFDEVMATGATKRVTIRFDGEAMAHLSAPGLGEAVEISMGALLCHGGYHEKGENRVCTKS